MLSRGSRHEEDRLVVSTHAGSYEGRFAAGDSMGTPAEESEASGDLARFLRAVRKRKGTILIVAFLGALAGLLIELPRDSGLPGDCFPGARSPERRLPLQQATSVRIPPSRVRIPISRWLPSVRFLSTRALQNRVVQKLDADKSVTISVPEDRMSAWRKGSPFARRAARES